MLVVVHCAAAPLHELYTVWKYWWWLVGLCCCRIMKEFLLILQWLILASLYAKAVWRRSTHSLGQKYANCASNGGNFLSNCTRKTQ